MMESLLGCLIWNRPEEDRVEVEGTSWASFNVVCLDLAIVLGSSSNRDR